jgi:hypothetical protein
MRQSMTMLGLCVTAATVSLAGCAGGGDSGEPTTQGAAAACALAPSCQSADEACLGLTDNAGKTRFGLRISQLDIVKPAALRVGFVGQILAGGVLPANVPCYLNGSGTFSWLLRFDTAAGTVEMGGARPVADATQGYRFLDEVVAARHLRPVTFDLQADAQGDLVVPAGRDLLMPLYLDAGATELVILPLRAVRLTAGTLSASQNCIGRYDATALRTDNGCFPDERNRAFVTGASLTGLIALEDADALLLPSFSESLCVYLSGDRGRYATTGADGVAVCKRDADHAIVFQGDACSVAGGSCTDAVAAAADLAASSVLIEE